MLIGQSHTKLSRTTANRAE